jgi:hypothetical protein
MSQTMMSQKQMKLAITAQENPTHRFTNLYSLMHWDYWINVQPKQSWHDLGAQQQG